LSAGRIDVCFDPGERTSSGRPCCGPSSIADGPNEPSFTLLLVRSGSVPKAIEFFLDDQADVPTARSKLVETFEVGGASAFILETAAKGGLCLSHKGRGAITIPGGFFTGTIFVCKDYFPANGRAIMARKYSKKASAKVERAMKERNAGTLKSGRSGRKVRSRKQAIAIGLSEARAAGAKVPRKTTKARKAKR
jgi:Family of unknown function (DUF6496)